MSGRHRVQRRRRVRLTLVIVPSRLVWRSARAAWSPVGRSWRRLVERAQARFERRDPFAEVRLAPQRTSPDPVPALAAAPVPPTAAPVEQPSTPEQAVRALHGQHPHLPGAKLHWRFGVNAVAGEVNALDADEAGQRDIVTAYAGVLAAPVDEVAEGAHVTVSTTGAFASVAFTITAVLLLDDTMPLPVFEEAAADPTVGDDTLSTQAIPDKVLAEVVSA
ncbi:hypothetical protein [Actinomadura decatromicini]|uniref:Uncharacterized protein n=1 Tax=Actinomadura decatromicini TaxID=2604572 RepID=A0A5D3FD24_9ACTN|nr:hypothetical protein [Actinomadura decatromicini]TYK45215.1 hypothetical protein FXF68_31555 [Actinomadura decatromicini]